MPEPPDKEDRFVPKEIKLFFLRIAKPKVILVVGLGLFITGLLINYFSGMEGELQLQAGESNTLFIAHGSDSTQGDERSDLNLILTLDSLTVHPYIPEYGIEVRELDTTKVEDLAPSGMPPTNSIGRFSMEPMKIRKIKNTDLRFRLKEFFPDFNFTYTYPDKPDTIEPKAPGILLELNTNEGSSIVTLRSDLPNRNKLSDIIDLGASLVFSWSIPMDSINIMAKDMAKGENIMVFSGENRKIYYLHDGNIDEWALKEKIHYTIPGGDSTGFTIIHCFPDVAYLKAIPSTRSKELINPVANVEIWKVGKGAQEAFLYPEIIGRNGGEFSIPGSNYMLNLCVSPQQILNSCDCIISIKNRSGKSPDVMKLLSGKAGSYQGFKFTPLKCNPGSQNITLQVTHRPGKKLVLLGLCLVLGSIVLMFLRK